MSSVIAFGISSSAAANWWLRNPNTGNTNNEYNVNTSGSSNNNNSNNSNGCAPDRLISVAHERLDRVSESMASSESCFSEIDSYGCAENRDKGADSEISSAGCRSGSWNLSAPSSQPNEALSSFCSDQTMDVDIDSVLKDIDQMGLDDDACSISTRRTDQLRIQNAKEPASYDRAISYNELLKATKQCSKGVSWKASVASWVFKAQLNCAILRKKLLDGTYKLCKYVVFRLKDPKMRIISSTRFVDRVVQRSLCNNGLYDMLTKSMIYDNGACLKGKGLSFCVKRLCCHLQRYYRKNKTNKGYYLKLDIKKYFDSTPHEMLKKVVRKQVPDEFFYKHVVDIIDSFEDSRPDDVVAKDPFGRRGIGLGSQISQLLQSLYLSELDHKIKEEFHIKYYVRYMDDMILVYDDRKYLEWVFKSISQYLATIGLQLNQKSKIGTLDEGIKFLKIVFHLTPTGKVKRRLVKKSINRELRRLRVLLKMMFDGKLTTNDIQQHINTWFGCNVWRMNPGQIKVVNKHAKMICSRYDNGKSQSK